MIISLEFETLVVSCLISNVIEIFLRTSVDFRDHVAMKVMGVVRPNAYFDHPWRRRLRTDNLIVWMISEYFAIFVSLLAYLMLVIIHLKELPKMTVFVGVLFQLVLEFITDMVCTARETIHDYPVYSVMKQSRAFIFWQLMFYAVAGTIYNQPTAHVLLYNVTINAR
eukprot:NODE_1163_length_1256_cov_76.227838_g946_i0.p1 GENE.NODE_1163_length_1256_cov_76.227838_g946_i0~~NODE_1163_length_1256_cov_76.227838_g946_i0.p1  ORF type:complete len:167 (+),score=29.85 NODE_1163_length_1256_cov_76.227838_g946_i0:621-1121(+)